MYSKNKLQIKTMRFLRLGLRFWVTTFALMYVFMTIEASAGGITDISELEWSTRAAVKHKRSYDTIVKELKALESESKGVKLSALGVNDVGEEIPLVKIGQGQQVQLVVAGQHGNEYGSVHFALELIKSLVDQPLKNKTIYIIPVLNVSGYKVNSREEIRPYTGHQVFTNDSNRDFLGPCTESKYTGKLTSTILLTDFIMEHKPHALINLHTSGGIITYPWGSEMGLATKDNLMFNKLSTKAQEFNNYSVGLFQDLEFGGYTTRGNLIDWAYEKLGVWSFLIELGPRSEGHRPSEATLEDTAHTTVPAVRSLLANAPIQRSGKSDYAGECVNYSKELNFIKAK